ncbi:SDR family oxidoreductase [Nocardioides piscis]|uniref:SDR family oxidoreductase n=2 Tax=Nocardioides piscis TaxID=2714938 RepID=A0A6G7YHG9_9ACTN|nr:SDR family oxidoreductase [Nocardioides piscis]
MSTMDFAGKTALVTGGTQGIGFAVAEALLAAGADVVVGGRREPSRLPSARGRTATWGAADIRDPRQAEELVQQAHARHGRLDVLVNNAGGSPDAPAASLSPRFAERVVALNLLAPFYLAQAANTLMQAGDGGSIINIGSVSGSQPQPGTAPYSAAKAGLRVLTNALAMEWAPRVRVNHITTGLVRTEGSAELYGDGAALAAVIPMGRLALPGDVAGAVLFLAGDHASYITGCDLAVHGGGELPSRYLALQGS